MSSGSDLVRSNGPGLIVRLLSLGSASAGRPSQQPGWPPQKQLRLTRPPGAIEKYDAPPGAIVEYASMASKTPRLGACPRRASKARRSGGSARVARPRARLDTTQLYTKIRSPQLKRAAAFYGHVRRPASRRRPRLARR